ncbi:hypothetical protein [Escherichia coli]|uniref:hypothetical protein n=1 Tax=Escherichia coli TaxID=562 RepID=UPI000DA4A028|nr:hypothetical protein [Escherichia coli]WJS34935.1 hypothetical protein QUS01_00870 [Escherichia coli]GCH21179.1 IS21 transposase Orf1 [Escherichia coli]SQM53242.1 transposase [Escherichia coli]
MLSREDSYMIKQMRQQGAYIVDIAAQIGCSERTMSAQQCLSSGSCHSFDRQIMAYS